MVLATAAVLLGLVVGQYVVIYHIVRQQGRLLLRLDAVEAQIRAWSAPPEPQGVAVGTPVAAFTLPGLDGHPVALSDFHGKPLVLLHWSPTCGFCARMAPDLAALQDDLEASGVGVLLAAYGTAAANRELAEMAGLDVPIGLLGDETPIPAFDGLGTPVAYLLDGEGNVAKPVAIGAEAVPELLRSLVTRRDGHPAGGRDLSKTRIERNGLPPGTPAPQIYAPDVYGNMVSLERYRGRRVLLVFSDPHCGPCAELAPDLARFYDTHRSDAWELVLVGRGEVADNREKAEAYGYAFPVVVQRRWEISRAYGIFSTPVAFLIDEEGQIAAPVAQGKDAVLALAMDTIETEVTT